MSLPKAGSTCSRSRREPRTATSSPATSPPPTTETGSWSTPANSPTPSPATSRPETATTASTWTALRRRSPLTWPPSTKTSASKPYPESPTKAATSPTATAPPHNARTSPADHDERRPSRDRLAARPRAVVIIASRHVDGSVYRTSPTGGWFHTTAGSSEWNESEVEGPEHEYPTS